MSRLAFESAERNKVLINDERNKENYVTNEEDAHGQSKEFLIFKTRYMFYI